MTGFIGGDDNDVFAPGFELTEEQMRAFLIGMFKTDFSRPCFWCGNPPQEGDVWRIDQIGTVIREGHSECFDEVKR